MCEFSLTQCFGCTWFSILLAFHSTIQIETHILHKKTPRFAIECFSLVLYFFFLEEKRIKKCQKTINYIEFITEAWWLRFLKKATTCCIGNYHNSCEQVIKVVYLSDYQLVHVLNYFLQCTNAVWSVKIRKHVHFIYIFIDIFEDGFIYMCVCVCVYIMYKSSIYMH